MLNIFISVQHIRKEFNQIVCTRKLLHKPPVRFLARDRLSDVSGGQTGNSLTGTEPW